jgi:hypothetical protein
MHYDFGPLRMLIWAAAFAWFSRESFAGRPPDEARQPPSPAEFAAKRLAWELEARKSVEVQTRTDIIQNKPDPQQPAVYDALDEHYIETALGQRMCDSRLLKSGAAVSRFAYFSDGSKAADVTFSGEDLERQKTAVIKRRYRMEDRSERMERPEPLGFLTVGREPLHKALRRAAYLGKDRALNRDCDVFLFTQVQWEVPQDQVFYLDKATSIPLKVESFSNEADRKAKRRAWVWAAESLDQVDGHFVALRSNMIAYSANAEPEYTWNFHVQSVAFDKDFPATVFWPVVQPGVDVFDAISGKSYKVPGATPGSPAEPSRTAHPIEASPPRGWMGAVSSVTMALGATIIIAACVLWVRRR